MHMTRGKVLWGRGETKSHPTPVGPKAPRLVEAACLCRAAHESWTPVGGRAACFPGILHHSAEWSLKEVGPTKATETHFFTEMPQGGRKWGA